MSLAARIQELFRERRGDERERVLMTAHLRVDGETERSVLLNISRSGAMMATMSPPPVGGRATLICEGLEAPARVVWNKGHQFGLAFDRPIRGEQVAAIVAIAGGKGAGR